MQNFDYTDSVKVWELAYRNHLFAIEYAECCNETAKIKNQLDILLIANIDKLLKTRKNLGYDSALILLVAQDQTGLAQNLYVDYQKLIFKEKGLKKILESADRRVILNQSLMRIKPQEN